MTTQNSRQAPGGNSTFSVGWEGENNIIKPSRKPGPIFNENNGKKTIKIVLSVFTCFWIFLNVFTCFWIFLSVLNLFSSYINLF